MTVCIKQTDILFKCANNIVAIMALNKRTLRWLAHTLSSFPTKLYEAHIISAADGEIVKQRAKIDHYRITIVEPET